MSYGFVASLIFSLFEGMLIEENLSWYVIFKSAPSIVNFAYDICEAMKKNSCIFTGLPVLPSMFYYFKSCSQLFASDIVIPNLFS
jgi:hypothetical protein